MAVNGTINKDFAKHETIFRDIFSNIQIGSLKPGQRLPTELELAKVYNLSRGSIRRGLLKLQEEGLIVKKKGSGTYVAREADSVPVESGKSIYIYNFTRPGETRPWFGEGYREGLVQGAGIHNLGLYETACRGFGSRSLPIPVEHLAGIIIFAAGTDKPSDLLAELPSDVPRVVLNRSSEDPNVPSLALDHEQGAFDAASFLIRIGHRRPALIYVDSPNPTYRQRIEGFKRAFHEAGLPWDDSLLIPEPSANHHHFAEWPLMLRDILKRESRPTALLMMNHGRALHILDVIRSQNLRVPEDLSLILFDEDPTMLLSKPAISTVRLPLALMARKAVDIIVEMRKGHLPSPLHCCVQPELMIRGSVGLPSS